MLEITKENPQFRCLTESYPSTRLFLWKKMGSLVGFFHRWWIFFSNHGFDTFSLVQKTIEEKGNQINRLRVVDQSHDQFTSVISFWVMERMVRMGGIGGRKFEYLSTDGTPMLWALFHNEPNQFML